MSKRELECCVGPNVGFADDHLIIVRLAERRLKHCECYTQTTILLKSSKSQT